MSIEGMQLASAMLSIHAADMDQAERRPDLRRFSRLERQAVLHRGVNRVFCRLGCLLERLDRYLQEYAVSRPDGLATTACNRAEANPRSVVQLG